MEAHAQKIRPGQKLLGVLLGRMPNEDANSGRAVRTFEGFSNRSSQVVPNTPPHSAPSVTTRDIVIRRPTKYMEDEYQEMQEITNLLRERRRVIINFENTPKENADKIFAWILGSMAAIGGNISAVDNEEKVFLLQPDPVDTIGIMPPPSR